MMTVTEWLAGRKDEIAKLVHKAADDYLAGYLDMYGGSIGVDNRERFLDELRDEVDIGQGGKVFDSIAEPLGKAIGKAIDEILERNGWCS